MSYSPYILRVAPANIEFEMKRAGSFESGGEYDRARIDETWNIDQLRRSVTVN